MRSGIPQPPASWSPDDITHTHTHTHKTRMYKKGKLSKKKNVKTLSFDLTCHIKNWHYSSREWWPQIINR
jgi:hypothetical protein